MPFRLLARSLLLVAAAALSFAPRAAWAIQVLVLGDSITEGYGVAKEDAYPALLEKLLQEGGHPDARVVNAGIAGATSASGASRLRWALKSGPQILILALGANDGLRGLKPEETEKNLIETVELARKSGVKVLLAGMLAPPNYGAEYTRKFKSIFPEVSKKEKVRLIPFLLENVAGDPALNQVDGIHPNEKGHRIVARTVLRYLKPML